MFFILQYKAIVNTPPKLVSPFSLNSLSASDLGQQIGFEQPKRLSGPRIVSLQELENKIKGREHVVSHWQVTKSGAMEMPVLLAAMLALPIQLLHN